MPDNARSMVRRLVPTALRERIVQKGEERHAQEQRRAREAQLDTAPARFEEAYAEYWQTGAVPDDAGDLLFLATWASGGELPRTLSTRFGRPFDAQRYAAFPSDLLDGLDAATVAGALERDGYYVAPFLLDEAAVDDISRTLDAGPAQPRGDQLAGLPAGAPAPTAPTWWMDPGDALRSGAVRRLMRERRVVETAGRYLGLDPMIMSIALWKTFAWETADKRSAQEFHYDNDRSAFLKMFVYLSDVGPDNGPHTYVPRSHGAKPKDLLHGGRLSDDTVAEFYPRDSWVTITGARGTVFFADTQGFHRGGRVTGEPRSMFQVNLATDRFGVADPPVGPAAEAPADLAEALAQAPRYFEQVFVSDRAVP